MQKFVGHNDGIGGHSSNAAAWREQAMRAGKRDRSTSISQGAAATIPGKYDDVEFSDEVLIQIDLRGNKASEVEMPNVDQTFPDAVIDLGNCYVGKVDIGCVD